MNAPTEYSAIISTHDDIKEVQLQQHDGINVAVVEEEKLFRRTWNATSSHIAAIVLIVIMGMVLLSLKASGKTNLFVSDNTVSRAYHGSYYEEPVQYAPFSPDCKKGDAAQMVACDTNFYLHKVTKEGEDLVGECCPLPVISGPFVLTILHLGKSNPTRTLTVQLQSNTVTLDSLKYLISEEYGEYSYVEEIDKGIVTYNEQKQRLYVGNVGNMQLMEDKDEILANYYINRATENIFLKMEYDYVG